MKKYYLKILSAVENKSRLDKKSNYVIRLQYKSLEQVIEVG